MGALARADGSREDGVSKRHVVFAAVAFAVAAALAWRLGGTPPSDEDRIRALFEDAARAAEEKRPGDAVAAVSERFRGHGLDRRGVKGLVAWQTLRGEWVSVAISGMAIAVEGATARATVDAVLSRAAGKGKGLADLLPGEATAHRFDCALELEDGEWRIVSADWRAVGLAEALAGPPDR
jgi:hypothetical protein